MVKYSRKFPSNFIFQNKQVIQQWERETTGLLVSHFMNNSHLWPMFHHVFVQSQVKPGTGLLRVGGVERKASRRSFPSRCSQTTSYQAGYSDVATYTMADEGEDSPTTTPQPSTILYPTSQTRPIMIQQDQLGSTAGQRSHWQGS